MDVQDKLVVEVAGGGNKVENVIRSTGEGTTDLQMMREPTTIHLETVEVPDLVLLYATLVHDGAVPHGYLESLFVAGTSTPRGNGKTVQ